METFPEELQTIHPDQVGSQGKIVLTSGDDAE